jgi:hypothetical protein
MKRLRDVPLRHRFAALVFGGTSLLLFGVIFALLRQADRVAPTPAWAWVLAALIAVVAAASAFFALGAWAALSDPKSRLGSWFQRKMSVADAAEGMVFQLCFEGSLWVGFFLIPLGGRYTIIGLALLFCSGLILFLVMRRESKPDIKALDDPNDNPRATDPIPRLRAVAASIAIIGALLLVARAGIFIAKYPLHKVALVPPPQLAATIDTTQDAGAWIARPFPSLNLGRCEILFQEGHGAIPGVNCLKSGGNHSDLLNKTK